MVLVMLLLVVLLVVLRVLLRVASEFGSKKSVNMVQFLGVSNGYSLVSSHIALENPPSASMIKT